MNFLSKLFKNKNMYSEVKSPMNADIDNYLNQAVESIPIPDKALFVETEKPSMESEYSSKISIFLGRNFHIMGMRDGYNYHSSENLTIGKRKIESEFRLIIDQEIQAQEDKLLRLENLIVDVSLVSSITLQKLQNTVTSVKSSIGLLISQKELSIEEEGWVMGAIYSYQQGYTQGITDYIDSEALLNSIKNI